MSRYHLDLPRAPLAQLWTRPQLRGGRVVFHEGVQLQVAQHYPVVHSANFVFHFYYYFIFCFCMPLYV